jgi:hypothetical protein
MTLKTLLYYGLLATVALLSSSKLLAITDTRIGSYSAPDPIHFSLNSRGLQTTNPNAYRNVNTENCAVWVIMFTSAGTYMTLKIFCW